jgi:hypothetical protein
MVPMDNVYTITTDTVCSPCTEPRKGQFVSTLCTIVADTKFSECGSCVEREEYIVDTCDAGSWNAFGEDISCTDCTTQAGDQYTVWHCDSTGFKDSLHADCSDCQDGEYLFAECSDSSDTVCPDCTGIANCGEGSVRCSDSTDSTCVECSDGFYGDTCCYEKQYSACGSMTTRERRADQYGYEGNSNEEFVTFCLELCDEFPDCMAFEVEDGGESYEQSGDNALSTKGAKCHFKSSFTQLTNDFTQDCYSNICRQGESFLDFSQYEEEGLLDQAKALVHSHKNGKNH